MKSMKFGMSQAVKDHLVEMKPITRLEALALYGISNLPSIISEMRDQGWSIESKWVPYARAVKRINEHAVFHPPQNLPIREVQLTEYWVSK